MIGHLQILFSLTWGLGTSPCTSAILLSITVLQVINFFFVPTQFRVAYVNVITLIWTVFLSYMKHKVGHCHDSHR